MLSKKQKALLRIRRYARSAARERLAGRMQRAVYWDDQIEKIYREASERGWSEGPFVHAEEEGRRFGGRMHRRYGHDRSRRRSPRRRSRR